MASVMLNEIGGLSKQEQSYILMLRDLGQEDTNYILRLAQNAIMRKAHVDQLMAIGFSEEEARTKLLNDAFSRSFPKGA